MKRRIQAAAVLLVCMMETPLLVCQAPTVESQVKAAFLYNFAQFVQWPSQAFTERDSPFTMCVAGDQFEGALEKTAADEMLNGHPIAIRRLTSPDNVRGCHLVFVGKLEAHRSTEIIAAARGMPVLTVGDSVDFINVGGMIRFMEVGHRIRFEINPEAADQASLRVSSRLLRVADIVRPRVVTR